jgi:hypothetical protein
VFPEIAVGKVTSGAHVFVLDGVTLQGTSARQVFSAYHAPGVNFEEHIR